MDITEEWQAHIDNGEYNESLMQQFGSDGSAYAVPYYLAYWPVWYNASVFDELGLSKPSTWSEFETLLEDIAAEDRIPLQLPLGDASWPTFIWFEEFLIHEDPEFYDALCAGEAKYTDDTAVWALEKIAEYQRNGYFGPSDRTFQLESPAAEQQLIDGEYIMRANGDWLSGVFTGNDLDFSQMDWFLLPDRYDSRSKRVIVEPGPIVPHRGADDEELTREIVDAMLGPEFQETVNKELGFAPVNQQVDPSFLVENKANLVNTIGEEDVKFSLRYWENTSPDVAVPATATMERLWQNPDQVNQVADELESIRQRVYEN
jgi:multiple sugar transport system substrate-binding protein